MQEEEEATLFAGYTCWARPFFVLLVELLQNAA
jgi:hypothetical protein